MIVQSSRFGRCRELDESFQLREDGVTNVIPKSGQALENWCSPPGSPWVESDGEGGIDVHAHGAASAAVGEARNFCPVLKRTASDSSANMMDEKVATMHFIDPHAGPLEDGASDEPFLMLVDDGRARESATTRAAPDQRTRDKAAGSRSRLELRVRFP